MTNFDYLSVEPQFGSKTQCSCGLILCAIQRFHCFANLYWFWFCEIKKASPVSGQAKVAMTFNLWNPRQAGLPVVKVLSFSLFPVTVMGIDCFGCV